MDSRQRRSAIYARSRAPAHRLGRGFGVAGLSEFADLDRPQFWIFYLAFAAAIPPLFALTKSWRLDALLGELSYPIYICHLTVIAVVGYFWNDAFSAIPYDYRRLVMTGTTVVTAAVLYVLIQRPTDTLRKWLRVARAQKPPAAAMQPHASVDQVVRV